MTRAGQPHRQVEPVARHVGGDGVREDHQRIGRGPLELADVLGQDDLTQRCRGARSGDVGEARADARGREEGVQQRQGTSITGLGRQDNERREFVLAAEDDPFS
ncbi:MAG: hypothetical protein R2736_19340 [Solirubrobacterales bacterium]